jgi:hypothetical protein
VGLDDLDLFAGLTLVKGRKSLVIVLVKLARRVVGDVRKLYVRGIGKGCERKAEEAKISFSAFSITDQPARRKII